MIQQIISHTPMYVWALLAFLIYRGVAASKDRESSLLKLAMIPAVMLYLSLSDLIVKFGLDPVLCGLWLTGALAGAALTWQLATPGDVRVNRADGMVFQRGSWVPLGLMAAIFITKYAVGVTFAMHPEAARNAVLVSAVTCLFGLFNGVFLGRLGRCVAAWLRQPAVSAA